MPYLCTLSVHLSNSDKKPMLALKLEEIGWPKRPLPEQILPANGSYEILFQLYIVITKLLSPTNKKVLPGKGIGRTSLYSASFLVKYGSSLPSNIKELGWIQHFVPQILLYTKFFSRFLWKMLKEIFVSKFSRGGGGGLRLGFTVKVTFPSNVRFYKL